MKVIAYSNNLGFLPISSLACMLPQAKSAMSKMMDSGSHRDAHMHIEQLFLASMYKEKK